MKCIIKKINTQHEHACQTLRLIHSAVRIQHKNTFIQYVPINQLEQYATLYGAFCFATLEAIEKLGADYNDKELTDYVRLWSIIGYFMGIDER